MKREYAIISRKNINHIIRIKDALDENIDPFFAELIDKILDDESQKFYNYKIQDDIRDLIERNNINV